jgi:hypothetical protein
MICLAICVVLCVTESAGEDEVFQRRSFKPPAPPRRAVLPPGFCQPEAASAPDNDIAGYAQFCGNIDYQIPRFIAATDASVSLVGMLEHHITPLTM